VRKLVPGLEFKLQTLRYLENRWPYHSRLVALAAAKVVKRHLGIPVTADDLQCKGEPVSFQTVKHGTSYMAGVWSMHGGHAVFIHNGVVYNPQVDEEAEQDWISVPDWVTVLHIFDSQVQLRFLKSLEEQ
jgi:hypothetical protein